MVCFVHFELDMCFAPRPRALFNIQTSKSAPKLRCFVHFDLEMCFAPQRRVFSTSQLPKVLEAWCALYILTWKCASCHNGVQLFISHLARWLRTRCFSELLFDPWKNTVIRNLSTFSRTCIFFLLTLSLLRSSVFFSSL